MPTDTNTFFAVNTNQRTWKLCDFCFYVYALYIGKKNKRNIPILFYDRKKNKAYGRIQIVAEPDSRWNNVKHDVPFNICFNVSRASRYFLFNFFLACLCSFHLLLYVLRYTIAYLNGASVYLCVCCVRVQRPQNYYLIKYVARCTGNSHQAKVETFDADCTHLVPLAPALTMQPYSFSIPSNPMAPKLISYSYMLLVYDMNIVRSALAYIVSKYSRPFWRISRKYMRNRYGIGQETNIAFLAHHHFISALNAVAIRAAHAIGPAGHIEPTHKMNKTFEYLFDYCEWRTMREPIYHTKWIVVLYIPLYTTQPTTLYLYLCFAKTKQRNWSNEEKKRNNNGEHFLFCFASYCFPSVLSSWLCLRLCSL